jgi:hypothetical protein
MGEESDTMTDPGRELMPLGPIIRLQVQAEKIKSGDGIRERYTPHENLTRVDALRLDSGGVSGVTVEGHLINDVHHRDHPRSRFRGTNGISLLTTGHYAKMREQFGNHLADGIAGESILIDCDRVLLLEDLAQGIVIGDGAGAVQIGPWSVAHPCAPFSRFAVQFPEDARPDRRLKDALQFLDEGTRGFYGLLENQPKGLEIRVGEMVYLKS